MPYNGFYGLWVETIGGYRLVVHRWTGATIKAIEAAGCKYEKEDEYSEIWLKGVWDEIEERSR